MNTFLNWLVGEAGAGWIIGLLGLVGALYTWLKRDHPPKIVIQEIERVRLLDIHSSQVDKLKVTYRKQKLQVFINIFILLYFFLMFASSWSSPLTQAYFNPTDIAIDDAVKVYQTILETRQKFGIIAGILSGNVYAYGYSYIAIITFIPVFILLVIGQKEITEYLALRISGGYMASEFERNPKNIFQFLWGKIKNNK